MGMPKYSQFKFKFYSDHFKVYIAVFLPSVGYLYLSVAKQFIFNREKQSFSHISADNTWSKPVSTVFPLSQATPWTFFPFLHSSTVYNLKHIQLSGLATVQDQRTRSQRL